MPEKVIAASLKLDSDKANASVKSFKTQLKEATNELHSMQSAFGETSKEAIAAAKKVAELKDRIGDAKNLTDAFNPDRKFQAFGNAVRGVTGGFAALTGTMALFGTESEDVQKTLLKVQAALAITEGVNNVLELKDTFKQLGAFIQSTTIFQKANSAATAVAGTVMKAFGGAVNSTSTSFKVLKGAIISTGIGALIIGITALVTSIVDWVSSTDDAAAAQDRLKNKIEDLNGSVKSYQDTIAEDTRLNTARAKAAGKSEEEIYKIAREGAIRNKQLLQGSLNDKYGYLQQLEKFRDKDGEGEKAYQDAKADYSQTYKEYNKANNDVEILELDRITKAREKAAAQSQRNSERAKQAAEKSAEANKQRIESEKSANEQLTKLNQENELLQIANEETKAVRQIKIEFENAKKNYEALKISEDLKTELIEAAEQNRNIKINQVREQYRAKENEEREKIKERDAQWAAEDTDAIIEQWNKENEVREELRLSNGSEFDVQRAELEKWYKDKMAIIVGNEELIFKLTEEYEKRKTLVSQTEASSRLSIVSDVLGKAADIVGKQTAAGKVLGIAQATINTFVGATEVLRAKSVLPEPLGTIAKIVNVGAIIATGLKAVKDIAKTPVPGGGGGGSVPSISAPLSPQLAPAQQTSTLLDQQYLNQQNNATVPVQAYVVESQGADAKERITRLNRAARLGG